MVWNAKESFIVSDETACNFPGGKYAMIITAGLRAHDLQKGAKPLIPDLETHKPSVIALMELEAGLITSGYPHDHVEPESKKVEEVEENI